MDVSSLPLSIPKANITFPTPRVVLGRGAFGRVEEADMVTVPGAPALKVAVKVYTCTRLFVDHSNVDSAFI